MVARTRVALVLILVLSFGRPGGASPKDFEAWASAMAFIPIEESRTYQLYLETQPRLGDDWQRMATALIRTALVYNPTPALSLFAGYGWLPTFYNTEYQRTYRDEHRLWQQILYRHGLWDIDWQHRLRQEQRWIEHTEGVSNRTRYMLRGLLPLDATQDFGLAAFDEVMFTWNSVEGGPWSGYDRNRIFLGPYWQIDNAHYEVGYLGEHAKRFGDDERWVNAIAVLAIFNF